MVPNCEQSLTLQIDPGNNNSQCEVTKYYKIEYLSKFLAEYTFKIKRLLVEHNIAVNNRYIKPTYSTKEDNNYKQYIKVASLKIPVNNVFALIIKEEAIKSFNEEGIYVNGINFT